MTASTDRCSHSTAMWAASHPTAIKHLADELTGQSINPFHLGRTKLEMTLYILDDMGELAPIVRVNPSGHLLPR